MRGHMVVLLVAMALLTAGICGLPHSGAAFTATTQNPGNAFETANSFKLTQQAGAAGCISETGTSGACIDGKALDYPTRVAISPDGTHLYVIAYNSQAVSWFTRDPATGQLSQSTTNGSGCISPTTAGCSSVANMNYPMGVAVSPDGKHVYVAAWQTSALFVFDRDSTTGALTKTACYQETGQYTCTDAKGIQYPEDVVVSADGKNVYVSASGSDAVSAFTRNTSTGALTQLAGTAGCISETGTGGSCVDGRALLNPDEYHHES